MPKTAHDPLDTPKRCFVLSRPAPFSHFSTTSTIHRCGKHNQNIYRKYPQCIDDENSSNSTTPAFLPRPKSSNSALARSNQFLRTNFADLKEG
ncbi:unnamed protein product [Ixodes pacificus]